ncbi:MAG TPA: L-threonylcarbamoyladenylate synthase [Thermoanaerobaculia bacterium]
MRRIELRDLLASPEEISHFREVLARGGVAALPTETFYALAADPTSERGVSRTFEVKGRDEGKPLLVLFSSRAQLERLGVTAGLETLDRFFRIWPAPLTAVFPLASPIPASRGSTTLGVRMPAVAAVRELLDAVGPLTGTSANRSGEPPLLSPDAVEDALGSDIDLIVDGGPTPGGEPSTVIDATREPPVVLRSGAFRWPPQEH